MKKMMIAALTIGFLSGCGSDDDNVVIQHPTEPPVEQPDDQTPSGSDGESDDPEHQSKLKYLTLDVRPDVKFDDFYIALGRFDDKVTHWKNANSDLNDRDRPLPGGEDKDANGDGWIDERDAHAAGVYNPEIKLIKIDAQKMHSVLMSNPDGLGAGTARPDIFVPGHYSAFDALRYLAASRDDLKLENVISPEESGRDTYEFEVSWDRNQDGVFDELDNDPDYPAYKNFKGEHWHFRFKYPGGDFRRTSGTFSGIGPQGELGYMRMDQFWIQPGAYIRFQALSPEMTERRRWVQDREMTRLAEAGGKTILPMMNVLYGESSIDSDGGNETFQTIPAIEVTAHNMRPDIFQPGVITAMDYFLSAADAGEDIKFNWWPTLSTGAEVNHFGLWKFNQNTSDVGRGWATAYGELATFYDFKNNTKCNFSAPAAGGMEISVDPKHCELDWQTFFGGNAVHIMSDVWPMKAPPQTITALWRSHYAIWGMPEFSGKSIVERDFSSAEDGSDIRTLYVLDLPTEGPLLSKSHFGWGIADCTQCHNDDKDPKGHGGSTWPVNTSDGFEEQQPHYCATCHGSNGAPKGHGETARCFWCHDSDGERPKHHGDASTQKLIVGSENLKGNKFVYNNPDSNNYPNGLPRDPKSGNYEEYSSALDSVNNDWNMSKGFPDPYSCMTCHPNK